MAEISRLMAAGEVEEINRRTEEAVGAAAISHRLVAEEVEISRRPVEMASVRPTRYSQRPTHGESDC